MKKTLTKMFTFFFILTIALCTVGCGESEPKNSKQDLIKEVVYSRISVYIKLNYDASMPSVTYLITEGDDTYSVAGKVTVRDKYGDSYTGKYDAVVIYNAENDTYSCTDLSLGKLYKD